MSGMTIGQLAAAAGVNVETVRYYQRRALLAPPVRSSGRIGRYSEAALTRLRFIKRAQALGFSLDDVQALLRLDDGQSCSTARRIGEHKLADVRARIRELQRLEAALDQLVQRCAEGGGRLRCPLIDQLMAFEQSAASVR